MYRFCLATVLGLMCIVQTGTGMDVQYRDCVLPSLDDEPMSLGQFRGRRILLIDFASW